MKRILLLHHHDCCSNSSCASELKRDNECACNLNHDAHNEECHSVINNCDCSNHANTCNCHNHDTNECHHEHFKDTRDHKSHIPHHECGCHHHDHDSDCGCGHEHASSDPFVLKRIVISLVLLVAGFIFKDYEKILFFLVFLVSGYPIMKNAINGLLHKEFFDENTLMTIASIGAILIGEFFEGSIVLLLYTIGEYLQSLAVSKSNASIQALRDIKPDFARVKVGQDWILKDPKEVSVAQIVQVLPNERIPLDGTITSGISSVDNRSITGESLPVDVKENDQVFATAINLNGVIEIEVTKEFSKGTYSTIEKMILEAKRNKAKSEEFIRKFAKIYTPIVTILAFIIAFIIPLLFNLDYKVFIFKGLEFLVCSCPCALVIAIPLSYFAGIGSLSKNGILVKGSNHIETLSKVNAIYFDKTNTLTNGNFKVVNYTSNDALKYAAYGEFYSNHPLAKAILEAYQNEIDTCLIEDYKMIAGKGISYFMQGKTYYVGSEDYMQELNFNLSEDPFASTIVCVASEEEFIGKIYIQDEIKEDAYSLSKDLTSLGIMELGILSGDRNEIVEEVKERLNFTKAIGNLLPEDKLAYLKMAKTNEKVLMFVGDGINDSPSLAIADLGVSMGRDGSDLAIETSDIVLMNNRISNITYMLKKARKIQTIVNQNIVFSILTKVVILILISFFDTSMLLPIFADVGVCLLAVLNSLRAMN